MGGKLSLDSEIDKQQSHFDFSPTPGQGSIESDGKNEELSVSFGYHCNDKFTDITLHSHEVEVSAEINFSNTTLPRKSSSFSCLSGAALGANATLANTSICNGLFGEGILPGLDSPKSFRKLASSPSLTRLEFLSSSQSSSSTSGSLSRFDTHENEMSPLAIMSAPNRMETSSFLKASDIQMAGGAAGEDRVQAVCSEENGWLFCGVYDGFNGRDAADFLAVTLYENIGFYLHLLEWRLKKQEDHSGDARCEMDTSEVSSSYLDNKLSQNQKNVTESSSSLQLSNNSYRHGILKCLQLALSQAESDFMYMVEQEMDNRPDLVTVGSCVLVALLYGKDLYTLNLGDSRAVLATCYPSSENCGNVTLKAVQLTETHTVNDEAERACLLNEHPDDPLTIIGDKVKGKLRVTRAFGVGYLKKSKLNDVLMGILRVRNLCSPPYVRTTPSINIHSVSEHDAFVILGSDGLFDFFSNEEVVELVHSFICNNPTGDPAKYIISQLMMKAAENAGMSIEQLMSIPVGRRRKYHDDVTVVIILIGKNQSTSTASVSL